MIVYLYGAFATVIDVDSAQYAAISMEMIQTNTYLEIYESGNDYLDKPPLIFWLSALSFALLGMSTLAFKLPTILFSILGLYYVYKLATFLFDDKVGFISVIILSSSLGYFWINSDVKTDALVTTFILISVYYLLLFLKDNTLRSLTLGSIAVAFSMLAKGPIGIVFPFAFVGLYILFNNEWKAILRIKWALLPLIVLVILSPMIYGLYQQFDLHPEKIVNGKQEVSGVMFYFWEQSFGRITGVNQFKNDTSFFYLFHCLLLLLLPFSLILVHAFYSWLKKLRLNKRNNITFLFAGTLLLMTALSLSSYKIPHYTAVVFPFCAIILAHSLNNMNSERSQKILRIHNLILLTVVTILTGFLFYCFPPKLLSLVVIGLGFMTALYLHFKKQNILALATIGVFLGLLFNSHLIPQLSQYTANQKLQALIKSENIDKNKIYFLNRESRALEFYLETRCPHVVWQDVLDKKYGDTAWYYMEAAAMDAFMGQGLVPKAVNCVPTYDINRIQLKFLLPSSRAGSLETHCLVQFKL